MYGDNWKTNDLRRWIMEKCETVETYKLTIELGKREKRELADGSKWNGFEYGIRSTFFNWNTCFITCQRIFESKGKIHMSTFYLL